MDLALSPELHKQLHDDVFFIGNPIPLLEQIRKERGHGVYRVAVGEALTMLHQRTGIPATIPTHFGCHFENHGHGRSGIVISPMEPRRPGKSTIAAPGSPDIHPL